MCAPAPGPSPGPWLAEPEDEMERMTEGEWRRFARWAWAVLMVLVVLGAVVIWGARG